MDNQTDNISNGHTVQNDTILYKRQDTTPSVTVKHESNLKIDKVITALFLVTDIMDKDEPLRTKLRDVGLNVLPARNASRSEAGGSDTLSFISDISEMISLINIAKSIKIISDMNSSILIREFSLIMRSLENKIEMKNSIENIFSGGIENPSLAGFGAVTRLQPEKVIPAGNIVQPVIQTSFIKKPYSNISANLNTKGARKESIINLIKDKKEVTTRDIALALRLLAVPSEASREGRGVEVSEKTIQRELISLMEQGLIRKSGEKRWSKYSLL